MHKLIGIELLSGEVPNAEPKQTAIVAEHIVWMYWREAQQRSLHGAPEETDLGEIGNE